MYGQLGVEVYKAEIPYLKTLEQDYHEQNIVFLSVSVDTNKDEWLKMVKDEELVEFNYGQTVGVK